MRLPSKNGKLSAELTAWYQCVLKCFHFICLKYCACQEKVMPSHTKCCTCQAKLMLQNATSLRKSALWPPNLSDGDASCTASATRHASSGAHACHRFCNYCKTLTFVSLLARCRIHCACHAIPHQNFEKWSETVYA